MAKQKKQKAAAALPIIHPHAAGIDVGSRTHFVATGQGPEQVKSFGVYQSDLIQMSAWLQEHGVTQVVRGLPQDHHCLKAAVCNGIWNANAENSLTVIGSDLKLGCISLAMAFAYSIKEQNAIYFPTFTVTEWADVFSRRKYSDIIIDSLRHCQKDKGLPSWA
jgi:hypothetical protein